MARRLNLLIDLSIIHCSESENTGGDPWPSEQISIPSRRGGRKRKLLGASIIIIGRRRRRTKEQFGLEA
jgi:hypothetical protein